MFSLACLAYFTTCGGPFGLESLVGALGPGWAVVLILVTPFVWSIPIALMVAELATLMPQEGGYYVWVGKTLGPFWAVQEAWWTMGYSVGLLAIFPSLFVNYLAFLFPALAQSGESHVGLPSLMRWFVAVVVIVTATVVNLLGARDVGRSAKVGATFVVGAFALLVLTWLNRGPTPAAVAGVVVHDLASHHNFALLLGVSIIVLNYSGWDNVSTYAAEVDRPQRNYPRAIALAMLAVVLSYLLPVAAGLSLPFDAGVWNSDTTGWPVIAQLIGGRWLGSLIAVAGLVSMWTLLNAQLLYVSRLPYVMACDGWLPRMFAKASPNTAVPKTVIICFCLLTVLFSTLSFGSLAVIVCVLYAGALTLEFLALIVVRLRGQKEPGAFRIPGGWLGMVYVCLMPLGFAVLVLIATLRDWRSFKGQLLVVAAIVVSGVVLFFLRRRVGPQPGSKDSETAGVEH